MVKELGMAKRQGKRKGNIEKAFELLGEIFSPDDYLMYKNDRGVVLFRKGLSGVGLPMDCMQREVRLYDPSIESQAREFKIAYEEMLGEEVTLITDYSKN